MSKRKVQRKNRVFPSKDILLLSTTQKYPLSPYRRVAYSKEKILQRIGYRKLLAFLCRIFSPTGIRLEVEWTNGRSNTNRYHSGLSFYPLDSFLVGDGDKTIP